MTIDERYDPLLDPDAQGCPHGCGQLTDDPYGGPCSRCWAALDEEQDTKAQWHRDLVDDDGDDWVPAMVTVRTVLDEPSYEQIAAVKRLEDR